MDKHVFQAKDLFAHKRGARSAAFRTALMSAMGSLALQSRMPLVHDSMVSGVCGWIAFYPSEAFIQKAPRIMVKFIGKQRGGDSARAIVDVGYMPAFHHRKEMSVEVVFPDMLLGLEGLLGLDSLVGLEPKVRFNGLFFNLTYGEHHSNLYEAVNAVCDAFELAESRTNMETAQA